MNGILALLVVALCVLGSAVVCMSIIIHDSKDSSRPAQRRHDQEYAPVRDVYVVLQTNNYTTYEEHTHQDNRQIHIHGDDEQRATLGTGRTEIEQGQYRSLPRQRQALNAPR